MSKFTLKNIDCELGVSVEINKVWYRLSSKLGSECTGTATLSDIKAQYDKCWKLLEDEIGSQIGELSK